MVAEIDIGVFVHHHVVVVGKVELRDGNIKLAIVGHSEFVPYNIMLKLREIGVTFVSHDLHNTASALGGSGGAVGLVDVEWDGKDTVTTIVGQLGQI